MEYLVENRESIEHGVVVRHPYILISIRDPEKCRVRIPRNSMCRASLELAFHDAEPVHGFVPERKITYISTADAEAIWSFLREHEGRFEAIVVHCEQGMSRSPAVAAAIAEGLGHASKHFWRDYQPNRFVYNCVLDSKESMGR